MWFLLLDNYNYVLEMNSSLSLSTNFGNHDELVQVWRFILWHKKFNLFEVEEHNRTERTPPQKGEKMKEKKELISSLK